jgi:hypothetical protein
MQASLLVQPLVADEHWLLVHVSPRSIPDAVQSLVWVH